MRELVWFCNSNCCANSCYMRTLDTSSINVPIRVATVDEITRFNLNKSPTILLVKDGFLMDKLEYKASVGDILMKLKSVGWSV